MKYSICYARIDFLVYNDVTILAIASSCLLYWISTDERRDNFLCTISYVIILGNINCQ